MNSLAIFMVTTGCLKAQLTPVFETDAVFRHPESAVFDPSCSCFYISNMDKDTPEDSLYTDFISTLGIDGKVLELQWMKGLSSPTGMVLHKGRLAVVERNGVAFIDLVRKAIIGRVPIATDGFLNDITMSEDGVYYISETSPKGRIYRIEGDKASIFLEDTLFAKPNGLLVDGDRLLMGVNGDNHLKMIDLNTRQVLQAVHLGEGNIDGIQKTEQGYLVSHFMGNLYLVSRDGTVKTLLDTRGQNLFIADFAWEPQTRLLIIPSLRTNKVYGYRYAE